MTDERPVEVATLKKLAPLSAMKNSNLQALARKVNIDRLSADELLFKYGDKERRTYWLLSGSLELLGEDGVAKVVVGGDSDARSPLSPKIPRTCNARAVTNIEYLSVDTEQLDMLLIWDQTGSYEVAELQADFQSQGLGSDDWMTALLQTKAFSRIPPSNIQAIFMRMQRVNCTADEVIIQQGADGDYFYAIVSGQCAVTRETPMNRDGIRLATLSIGDTFGEEALISEAKRNATIKMLTDGSLMRLSKQDFRELMNDPIQQWIEYADAQGVIERGGKWLDVRLPSEYQTAAIPEAINIPLYFIRLKMGMLDKNVPYVVYCDTGRRSSAAAFILLENGFDAYTLRGGIGQAEPALRKQA
jgi:CRP-like cAMP-binding protein/rhodanese-related sulfurtransferase